MELFGRTPRTPFSNFDLVVYFGAGLFSLPFIRHYFLQPTGLRFPHFEMGIDLPFGDIIVGTLALLFSVYALGHIIAYVSSQVIEKSVEVVFGRTSEIIYLTSLAEYGTERPIIKSNVKKNLRKWNESWPLNTIKLVIHSPFILMYLAIYRLSFLGFYVSRVPREIFNLAQAKAKIRGLNFIIGETPGWYRFIEGYVVNNCQIGSARRYNYRVISGLFRSMALIFLTSIWCELIFIIGNLVTGSNMVDNILSDKRSLLSQLFALPILTLIYVFSLLSYLKFQRRCVETAIFAFALVTEVPHDRISEVEGA